MRSKKRTILVVLAVAAAMLLLLAGWYAHLVSRPTGYEKLRPSFAAAVDRIGKDAASGAHPIQPVSNLSLPENKAAQSPATPPREFFTELMPFLSTPDVAMNTFVTGYLNRRDRNSVSVECDQLPKPGGSLWAVLKQEMREVVIDAGRTCIENSETITAGANAINEELDRLDEFLLRPGKKVPALAPRYDYNVESFYRKVLIAIERACLRGDPAKALKLLDGFFETVRVCNVVYVSDVSAYRRPVVPDSWFWRELERMPNLPPEWRDRACKSLEAIQNTTIARADALLYSARAWHDSSVAQIDGENLAMKNTWHYFGSGRLETAARKAFYPIAIRQIESMTVSFGNGNQAEMTEQSKRLRQILTLMNMSGYSGFEAKGMFRDLDSRPLELKQLLNRPIAMMKGWVKLLPQNEAPFQDTPDEITIERFGAFKIEPGRELTVAYFNYSQTHRRGPSSPDEIESFIKEHGHGDDWRQKVIWYKPGKVRIGWRRIRSGAPPPGQIKYVVAVQVSRTEDSVEDRYKAVLLGKFDGKLKDKKDAKDQKN